LITYAVEDWQTYFRDCQELWREHYEEIAARKDRMAMDPDVPTYERAQAENVLVIVSAREAGKMVGYVVCVTRRHMHYNVYCGFEDAYFLSASHRQGMAGVRLIKEAVKALKRRGCQWVFFHSKEHKPLDRIFKFLGFSRADSVHSLWLEDCRWV
jgi:L-amino acid N-acyltransferase YncA